MLPVMMEHHESNIIAADFQHGKNLKMGYNCVIQEGCVVGDDVTIEHFVLLKAGTIIGSRVFVDSYVKSSGDNLIGDDVTLRFNCTIAREVTVEDGAFISPNVMTIYSTHDGDREGGTVIGKNAFLGTNVVVGPNVRIGAAAVIGSLSMVTKDCDADGIYTGIPAKKTRSR